MYILWFETDDPQDTATSMVLKRLHHSKKYVDAWDTYVQNRRRSVPTGGRQVGSRGRRVGIGSHSNWTANAIDVSPGPPESWKAYRVEGDWIQLEGLL